MGILSPNSGHRHAIKFPLLDPSMPEENAVATGVVEHTAVLEDDFDMLFLRSVERETFGRESASVAEDMVGKCLVKLHLVVGHDDRLFKGCEIFAGIYERRHEMSEICI